MRSHRPVVPSIALLRGASRRREHSVSSAPDYARTFRVALSELMRHDAQAEMNDGAFILTGSHRPDISRRLFHELLPLHESLLRRMCQVPLWYLYGQNKGAAMLPVRPDQPHGAVTIPLFTSRPTSLPHAAASEILELSLASLLSNLPSIKQHTPRLHSIAIEPRGLDFTRCLHLPLGNLPGDLGDIATAMQFEENLVKPNPAVPRALPMWVFQQGSSMFGSILGPAFAASTSPDPLLERLATAQNLEPAKGPPQLSHLGIHTHAFLYEGSAMQFAQRHTLGASHKMVRLPANVVFSETKDQQRPGVYVHLSSGGVALNVR